MVDLMDKKEQLDLDYYDVRRAILDKGLAKFYVGRSGWDSKRLLEIYAHRRQWKESRYFSVRALSQRLRSSSWTNTEFTCLTDVSFFDHLRYWKQDGFPIAITTEPYLTPESLGKSEKDALSAWAREHKVCVTHCRDFPSWHNNPHTSLWEITR